MPRSARIRNILEKSLLVVSSTLLTLLVLEVAVRVGFSAPRAYPHLMKRFFEHDPLLGWRHKSNCAGLFFQSEHETTLRYNSQAIRGPEYPLRKRPGEFRIAVIGDSFSDGYTVEFEDLFSEVLERHLIERSGRQVEVINFGVAGYSTDQELLLYRQKVKRYQPDLTILMFHDNDTWFNTVGYMQAWGSGHKPFFRKDGATLKLTNVPVPLPSPDRRGVGRKIKDALHRNSSLYRLIVQRVKSMPALYSLAHAVKLSDLPYDQDREGRLVPKSYGVYRKTYSPEIRAAWEVTEMLLAELKREADAIGSELMVFYVPQKAAVYPGLWEKAKQYYAMTGGEWIAERVAQELGNVLERLKVEYVNPLERMRQHKDDPARRADYLYFLVDGHWNEEGNRLVGEMLADHIVRHLAMISNGVQ